MKNIQSLMVLLAIISVTILMSCKKDGANSLPLDRSPENFNSVVDGFNIQLQWTAPEEDFDHYLLQISKSEDFSTLEFQVQVDRTENSYIYRKIDAGVTYFARIRTMRTGPESFSRWTELQFMAAKGNILSPILRENVNGPAVTLRWNLEATDPTLNKVTRIVLVPHVGQQIEIPLSPQHIQAKSITYDKLSKDTRYTVRIYNENFVRGTQIFTTIAQSVNGIWTLGSHSDLKAAIEQSKTGDKIILKAGIYSYWNESILINNKNITISAEENSVVKPKVYVSKIVVKGLESGLSLNGLDLSGARLSEFKQEIPNNPDTRWSEWLLSVEDASSTFATISFDDCIIRSYNTGLIKMVKGQIGNKLVIHNSIIHHLGEDQLSPLIEIGPARIKEGIFSNSTYYMAGKMFIMIDREANLNNDILFTFKNNTVDRSWSASAFDFKASKAPTRVLLENNIFSNITSAANFFSNFAQLANNFDKRLINCNFHNVNSKATIYGSNQSNMPVHSWELRHPNFNWNEVRPAFLMNGANHPNPHSVNKYSLSIDPEYKNATNLDFTIPANNALRALVPNTILGDPRWW